MKETIENIINAVCDVCDVEKDALMSKSREAPLPMFRGLMWLAMRMALGATNVQIANMLSFSEKHFSPAGVGIGINKAIQSTTKEKYWKECWEKLTTTLNLPKRHKNENIHLTLVVPYGMKSKVRVDIKEKEKEHENGR